MFEIFPLKDLFNKTIRQEGQSFGFNFSCFFKKPYQQILFS